MIVGSLLCFKNPITQVAYAPSSAFTLIIDKNGYIGSKQPAAGNTYYAYLDKQANFSESGLGQVTIIVPEIGSVEIGGKTYKTTKIGNQTWLAENLDLKWDGLVIGSSSSSDSQRANYYNNNESTYGWDGYRCGLLYNGIARDYLNNNRSTLCSGWHVPTPTEWDTLISTVNSRFSCSQQVSWSQNWTGNNYMGLGFIPSGQRYQSDSSFHDIGNGNAFFSTAGYAYFMGMLTYRDSIHKESSMSYKSQYSLRLVKDT